MTVITSDETGYLERPYMEEGYATSGLLANSGIQATLTIRSQNSIGTQASLRIADQTNSLGLQSELSIRDRLDVLGLEFKADTLSHKLRDDGEMSAFLGMQTLADISDLPAGVGVQVEHVVGEFLKSLGFEVTADKLSHKQHGSYLEGGYMEDNYLVEKVCAFLGVQTDLAIAILTELGTQTQLVIKDFVTALGMQSTLTIEDQTPIGMQADLKRVLALGFQTLATLYNTTNLRILCDFPSRGDSTSTGNNTWGNPSGVGQNWKVNVLTDTGPDHEIENVNTDIVEQTWQSLSATTGINLDCDTERPQGLFLDTLSIQNHNLTRSATVQLIGSNDSNFGSIGVSIHLTVLDEKNIYYIAETLPSQGFRYWRLSIDDGTNPDGFISIGTILFGASRIFNGECITDEIELERKDFASTIETEGFTNVANSRALKKAVTLEFRSLDFERGNYRILRDIFNNQRTILKCLWIPTPDVKDEEFMARFAVFAKIVAIPRERHNSKGRKLDFASFQLELDESK